MSVYQLKKPRRINSVSVGLAVIFAVLVYAAWFLVPMFWPLLQVSGMARRACAHAYAEPNDQVVFDRLLKETRRTRLRLSKDNFRFERIPYSEESLRGVPALKQDRALSIGETCEIAFRYVGDYELPLIGATVTIPYETSYSMSLVPRDDKNWLNELAYGCRCAGR